MLLVGCLDDKLAVWNVESDEQIKSLTHDDWIIAVAFSSTLIASGSLDNNIKLWDLTNQVLVKTLNNEDWVLSLAFCPSGQYLASGSRVKNVRIWDLERHEIFKTIDAGSWVNSMTYSQDCFLITGSRDGKIIMWTPKSCEEMFSLKSHNGEVKSVAISPSGKYLVTGGTDKTVKMWNLEEAMSKDEATRNSWSKVSEETATGCLLYTSDAADE